MPATRAATRGGPHATLSCPTPAMPSYSSCLPAVPSPARRPAVAFTWAVNAGHTVAMAPGAHPSAAAPSPPAFVELAGPPFVDPMRVLRHRITDTRNARPASELRSHLRRPAWKGGGHTSGLSATLSAAQSAVADTPDGKDAVVCGQAQESSAWAAAGFCQPLISEQACCSGPTPFCTQGPSTVAAIGTPSCLGHQGSERCSSQGAPPRFLHAGFDRLQSPRLSLIQDGVTPAVPRCAKHVDPRYPK